MGRQLLIRRISSQSALQRAWNQVRNGSSPKSYGPDNIRLREFAATAKEHLTNIGEQLRTGTFKFSLPRGHAIAKTDDAELDDPKGWRGIVIANICDRVVQRAILNESWTRMRDHVCTPGSFGGIRPYLTRKKKPSRNDAATEIQESPAKCVKAAAGAILAARNAGNSWVFETDIESFYPSVDRTILMARLVEVLDDDSINELLVGAINTSISNFQEQGPLQSLWDPTRGVPQGGILSPMLANFYLGPLDVALNAAGFNMVRYVDDLVILADTRGRAESAYELTKTELSKLGLRIHKLDEESNGRRKTRILEYKSGFVFLGLKFTTHAIKPTLDKTEKIKHRIEQVTELQRKLKLHEIIQKINARVMGWVQAYNFCSLTRADREQLDLHAEKCVRRWLRLRGFIKKDHHTSPDAFRWLGLKYAAWVKLEPLLPPRKAATGSDGKLSLLTISRKSH